MAAAADCSNTGTTTSRPAGTRSDTRRTHRLGGSTGGRTGSASTRCFSSWDRRLASTVDQCFASACRRRSICHRSGRTLQKLRSYTDAPRAAAAAAAAAAENTRPAVAATATAAAAAAAGRAQSPVPFPSTCTACSPVAVRRTVHSPDHCSRRLGTPRGGAGTTGRCRRAGGRRRSARGTPPWPYCGHCPC